MAELDVRLWRGDGAGRFERYRVPRRANQTVLDVVTWVQRHLAPDLAYRFACRVGMCGSCAMTVNGRPRWTCRSHVSKVVKDDRLEIGPLRNLPVIRDLAVDMSGFFDKWQDARGRFAGTADRHQRPAPIDATSPARRQADAAIECINCAVCYAACETVAWRPGYLGPAALNRAWTLAQDERDGDGAARRAALGADDGVFTCHSHGACSEHCPVGLDPAGSIADLKRWALFGG
ncbi:MAG: 2Fe-2S iron-sulfur cluster-binding protein [Pseudomonadota bacterium]